MKLLSDTSAYSGLMHGVAEVLDLLSSASQVLVPSVVLGELRSRFRRGSREAVHLRQLEQFLSKPQVLVVNVTSDIAARYAEVDFYLFSKSRPIPRNDVWIAALALEHGAILLTSDAHFRELSLLPIRP